MATVETAEKKYLTCAETAKLVRKALKEAFPKVKFSVRSDVYSGGASIDVSWTDGPIQKTVENSIKKFEGSDFDGMIDLKTYIEHWLMPDGSVVVARRYGHSYSEQNFTEQNTQPHPEAQLVSMGADFIFANRNLSPEATAKFEAIVAAESSRDYAPNESFSFFHDGRHYEGWGTQMVWQLSCQEELPSHRANK